ncbi:MAG: hypothetical protein ACRD3B_17080 [Candidatus Sulfotelmatobacter sp.]
MTAKWFGMAQPWFAVAQPWFAVAQRFSAAIAALPSITSLAAEADFSA